MHDYSRIGSRFTSGTFPYHEQRVRKRATIADFDLCDQINSLDAVPACCHSQGMNARSWLQILLLSAVWGVSFLMIRIAGAVFPPFWVALLRCTLGAALMWAVLLLAGTSCHHGICCPGFLPSLSLIMLCPSPSSRGGADRAQQSCRDPQHNHAHLDDGDDDGDL